MTKINLIGEKVKITWSSNKTLIGLSGQVVDETKNTVTIDTGKKDKKVLKKEVRFKINTLEINGENLIGRPEERLKKKEKVKKRW